MEVTGVYVVSWEDVEGPELLGVADSRRGAVKLVETHCASRGWPSVGWHPINESRYEARPGDDWTSHGYGGSYFIEWRKVEQA